MRRVTHAVEEVDDVEETLEPAILEIIAYRDKSCWDTTCHTHGVLDIQVGLNTCLVCSLRILTAV